MADARLFDSRIWDLEVPDRSDHSRAALDLSRNELVHPDLDPLVGSVAGSADAAAATRYPSYGTLRAELAEALGCAAEGIEVFPGSDDAIATVLGAVDRDLQALAPAGPLGPRAERVGP